MEIVTDERLIDLQMDFLTLLERQMILLILRRMTSLKLKSLWMVKAIDSPKTFLTGLVKNLLRRRQTLRLRRHLREMLVLLQLVVEAHATFWDPQQPSFAAEVAASVGR